MFFHNQRLFRDIALLRSISRGAAQNAISQSAASQHIQDVEKRLGTGLFDRSTRPFALTPAGKLYYEFCRDVIRREEELCAAVADLKAGPKGSVHVASIYSIGLSELSHLKEEYAVRYPQFELHVDYMRPDKVYEAVLAGAADFGLVSYPEASRQLAAIEWRREEMAVAAAPSHPLAARAVVRPSDLDGVEYVGFDDDLTIRHELDRFFRERGVRINVVMQFDNIQMIKEAVALGSGVSVLPARTMQAEIEQGRLVSIPLEAPELTRPVGIVYRKRKRWNEATESFIGLLHLRPEPKLAKLAS